MAHPIETIKKTIKILQVEKCNNRDENFTGRTQKHLNW